MAAGSLAEIALVKEKRRHMFIRKYMIRELVKNMVAGISEEHNWADLELAKAISRNQDFKSRWIASRKLLFEWCYPGIGCTRHNLPREPVWHRLGGWTTQLGRDFLRTLRLETLLVQTRNESLSQLLKMFLASHLTVPN